MHPGMKGLLTAGGIFGLIWVVSAITAPRNSVEMEPRGAGSFESHFRNYFEVAKLILSLAVGSIVLLIGYLEFLTKEGSPRVAAIQAVLAPPLVLLACSVVFGAVFLGSLAERYESFTHGQPYTRFRYSLNVALGFSCLVSFSLGYVWLALGLMR